MSIPRFAISASVSGRLWTYDIGGSSRGVPAMYEIDGREYLVISAAGGGGRGELAPGPAAPASAGDDDLIG